MLPLALSAQEPKDAAPLKYWSAPLYWLPSSAQFSSAAKIATAASAAFPTTPLMFVAITPCRVIDTRSIFGFPSPFGAPSLVGGATRSFPMQASTLCNIPASAAAYSLNVTVTPVGGASLGFLTLWPLGSSRPNASTVNNPNALPAIANAAIVPAGNDGSGSVDAYASSTTDLIIDINGYYASPSDNTNLAIGLRALQNNTGNSNTAVGGGTLFENTSGSLNTAIGDATMFYNVTGNGNTATGAFAMQYNITGSQNAAHGAAALQNNTSGQNNTAFGYEALQNNTTGSGNIAVGTFAATNVSNGNGNNIHIGNQGGSADNSTIRIGTSGTQTSFFAAGVSGITTGLSGAVPVVIDANGQLGTVSSSARYKEDIHDMADASTGLLSLRPVTFRYRQPYADGTKPLDYGLIAEEVGRIYPDLVVKDADGQIQTLQYQKLTPMLLNELQKQQREIQELRDSLAELRGRQSEK